MSSSSEVVQKDIKNKKPLIPKEDIKGTILVILFILALIFIPHHVGGIFRSMFMTVKAVVVDVFINDIVGMAIMVSVIVGRIMERLGFTDALLRIFIPYARLIGVSSTVFIAGVYNILGDVNAAGRIGAPVLQKGGATLDEKKIAIATMVQAQQSLSTFMMGLICFANAGLKSTAVVLVAVFGPLFIVPLILSKTIWRNTKSVEIDDLPRFTPTTGVLETVFGAGREAASILFLLIIPALTVIFSAIGFLDYLGIWAHVQTFLTWGLQAINVHPETGTLAVLAAPDYALAELGKIAAQVDPKYLIGTFVIASSGLPLCVIFGQIPAVWSQSCEISDKEALKAAVLGIVMRFATAALLAAIMVPLLY